MSGIAGLRTQASHPIGTIGTTAAGPASLGASQSVLFVAASGQPLLAASVQILVSAPRSSRLRSIGETTPSSYHYTPQATGCRVRRPRGQPRTRPAGEQVDEQTQLDDQAVGEHRSDQRSAAAGGEVTSTSSFRLQYPSATR
jgi:hypothetical protein